jgi:hypothetical protein
MEIRVSQRIVTAAGRDGRVRANVWSRPSLQALTTLRKVMFMTMKRYFQPVAIHRTESERLLLTDDAKQWYLWLGEADGDPVQIPEALAWYLTGRDEMQRLESPRMWFAVSDLPLRDQVGSEREHDADTDEFGRAR